MLLLTLASISTAAAAPFEFSAEAFSIRLTGTPVEAQDDGLRGHATLNSATFIQTVSWSPATVPLSGDRAVALLESAKQISASALGVPMSALVIGPVRPSIVDGQEGMEVLAEAPDGAIALTMWNCPVSGVQALLLTGGDASAVAEHRQAVASVRCGQSGVRLRSLGFKFVGQPSEWTLTDGGDPLVQRYVSANKLVRIRIWARPERTPGSVAGKVCEGALRASVDDYLARSSAKVVSFQASGSSAGCQARTQGVWNDGGELSLLSDARVCKTGMVVSAHVLSEDPKFDLDSALSLWECE